jgi:Rha family phage regulatory protein
MNELVFLKNEEALTDSLSVAEMFEKRHDHVLVKIEKILNDSPEKSGQCFHKTRYKDNSGKLNVKYLMNRDGFTFLAMGFTGRKADTWKWKYIDAFNAMEKIISEKKTAIWLETRQRGKLIRRDETNIIQRLVEYAKDQGSTHADMLYMTYSKLANKMAGITSRDQATTLQLNDLSTMERIIAKAVIDGMGSGMHYKDIYKLSKERLETVTSMLEAS